MSDSIKLSAASRFLITFASLVIVIVGIRAASTILVPFLLAAVFAILCSQPLLWLQRKGVPKLLALLIISLGIIVIGLGLTRVISRSLGELAELLPQYEARLEAQEIALMQMISDMGVDLSGLVLTDVFSADVIAGAAGNLIAGLGGVLTSSLIILFIVIFMLLEAAEFPTKLRAALGASDISLSQFNKYTHDLNNYLVIKSWMSLATGISVTAWLTILNIDFALLWGLVAFLFNYIPNIGSIIAAVPAILLGFIQYGVESALYVTIGYLFINNVMSYLIEPRFMGYGLNLSTLVVFLSLVFWGWMLGAAGLLLALPLTVLLKMVLENNDDTRWIAILLGSEKSALARLQDQEQEPSLLEPLDNAGGLPRRERGETASGALGQEGDA